MTAHNIAFYMLALATFVTFLSAQLISPIVPVLAKQLGAEQLDIAAVSGIHFSLLAVLQIFTGAFADRFGKRRTIAIGAFLAAICSLLYVTVFSWEQILFLGALSGVADAVVGPALLALVAELSGERKGRAMGIFRSSQGLAFIMGPALGAATAKLFFLTAPFFVDFILTILGILLFLYFVQEKKGEPKKLSQLNISDSLKSLGRDLKIMKIGLLGFSETFAFSALFAFLPAYVLTFGMAEVEIGVLFSIEAVTFAASTLFVGILSDKVGRKPVMSIGLLLFFINLVGFFFSHDLIGFLGLMALFGFTSASVYVMSSTMAADILPEENRAMLFGTFDALMDLGIVFGPAFCLALLSVTRWDINYSFLLMSIPTAVGIFALPKVKETRKKG